MVHGETPLVGIRSWYPAGHPQNNEKPIAALLCAACNRGRNFRYITLNLDRGGDTLGTDKDDQEPSPGHFTQSDFRNSRHRTGGAVIITDPEKRMRP